MFFKLVLFIVCLLLVLVFIVSVTSLFTSTLRYYELFYCYFVHPNCVTMSYFTVTSVRYYELLC